MPLCNKFISAELGYLQRLRYNKRGRPPENSRKPKCLPLIRIVAIDMMAVTISLLHIHAETHIHVEGHRHFRYGVNDGGFRSLAFWRSHGDSRL